MKYINRFRVAPGSRVRLKDTDLDFKDKNDDHHEAAAVIERDRTKLRTLQALLSADRANSLLICLQGTDSAGKDGTINHVQGAMNPKGSLVATVKPPTAKEAAHDFLWRVHQPVPANGEVVIFNRSQYEDVLSRCSTEHAPWFVIPSNHKWFRNLSIARLVVEHLEALNMKFPPPTVNLEHIRREYHAAKET